MTIKIKWKQYINSTLLKRINMVDSEGNPYLPSEGDKIVFHICERFEDENPLLEKEINVMIECYTLSLVNGHTFLEIVSKNGYTEIIIMISTITQLAKKDITSQSHYKLGSSY